jgi:cobalt-zinc-cadmium efflux system protein
MGSLGWEAVQRLGHPEPVQAVTVMVVAAIGIVVNGATALLFLQGSGHDGDLNVRGAFLHMAGDALVSAGVVGAAALTWWRGWTWVDPVTSLLIALIIVVSTWGLFRQSLHLLFDGVPDHIDLGAVQALLADQPGVAHVEDLHVWAMGTMQVALTAHLVMPDGPADDDFVRHVTETLTHRFGIAHVTLQSTRTAVMAGCIPR